MKRVFSVLIVAISLLACDNHDVLLSSSIIDFIQKEYSGATIRNAEYDDDGFYEVEIRHNSYIKDVHFDKKDNWVYTTWDVRVSNLPEGVKSAVSKKYPGYRIDDVDFIESPEKSYYRIEIENGGLEQTIYVSKEGNFN